MSEASRDVKVGMTRELMVDKVTGYFQEYTGVLAVYFFGSFARDGETRFSDVDVAVLLDEGDSPGFGERLRTTAELSRLLKRDVDLVYLNDSSCVLRMQVIRKGTIILNREPRKLNQFVVNTLKEYFDLKMVRRPIEKKLSRVSIFD